MSDLRLRTVLIGAGRVGARYADDPVMARHFRYASHAQVLAKHPQFAWEAVVDPCDDARQAVQRKWNVPHAVSTVAELKGKCEPEVATLAIPSESRLAVIEQLPSLRAVLVEKPLGHSFAESHGFIQFCQRRNILVQVNFWMRGDETFRRWARDGLAKLTGPVQCAFALYGNGLRNNGSHIIDFVRMMLGEVEAVQALGGSVTKQSSALPSDLDIAFILHLALGIPVMLHPLVFQHYRENGLDIWGEAGRLGVLQEGLGLYLYPRRLHRAAQHEWEIASDEPEQIRSTAGEAFYHMYTNLAAGLAGQEALWSPAESALRTEGVIEAVLRSAKNSHEVIRLD